VKGMRESLRITIIPLSSELLNRGMELMRKRSDKDWSLTNCTSFILMEDAGIKDALTADRNFEQAGLAHFSGSPPLRPRSDHILGSLCRKTRNRRMGRKRRL
jgi:hypothetical protein